MSAAIADSELIEALEKACWLLESEDQAGNKWCDEQGYDGYTSYASLDDLPERFPPFSQLKTLLTSAAEHFAEGLHWETSGTRLVLDSLWVNILGEGGTHSSHLHPNSVISGTYYVSVPAESGRLKLEDPRLGLMMAAPPIKSSAPDTAKRFIYITPKAGEALFWESWLRHEVVAGRTSDPRISISYNFSLQSSS